MFTRVRAARHVVPVAFILSAALIFSGMLLSGCGSAEEEAQEPAQQEDAPIEITADEVPVVREGEDPEAPAEQADAEAEDAEEQQPPAEEAEEAPAEAEGATPPAAEPEASADDEQPGLLSKIGGALKTVGVVVGKLLFVLILPAAIAGTLVGMPGGILVLADATIFSAFHGWAVPPWWVLLILVVIAVLAEVAENLLSFTGVKRSGASNTTGVWVMVGGFAGAMLGGAIAPVFSGIGALAGPVGWVILSVIPPIGLGMLGGFLGGYYFEIKRGKDPEEAKKAGWGALTGRLAGSFTKAMLVAVMAAIVLISTWGALF